MSPVTTIVLTTLAATLFMSATWVMKTLSQGQMFWSMPLIFLLLGLAAWVEIEVLRATRMGHVIVIMLAIELLLTFVVACFFLQEHYTTREFMGVAVIIVGIAMLSSGEKYSKIIISNTAQSDVNSAIQKSIIIPNGAILLPRQTFRTSTPGKSLPSIHSRNAPPAVEI